MAARSNILKHVKVLKLLWVAVEEAERDGDRYGHVMFLQDDAYWLEDFTLAPLLGAYPPTAQKTTGSMYLYTLNCMAPWSSFPNRQGHINNYVLIAGRDAAGLYGAMSDKLFEAAESWGLPPLRDLPRQDRF